MTDRIEDRLVEHMRSCSRTPGLTPGEHFRHGDCPEYRAIIASIPTGPLIPFNEYMGWSPSEVEFNV